ncbi:MAG: AmmeMemoRadiSam system protein B [Terriglobales bacterium]
MGAPAIRHPAVAGRFYPKDQRKLLADIHTYVVPAAELVPALGCIVPHAGYMYSGHVAGAVYAQLDVPARCIVLCPNHTGMGTSLSIMSDGVWETPLGDVPVDSELAADLLKQFSLLSEDSAAHVAEHAIEVQLPFLQAKRKDVRFVPIAIGTRQYAVLAGLGEAIGEVLSHAGERILVLASSDMNHYESDPITRVKDQKAIERILALDPRGLYEVVTNEEISMCGYGPAVAMLSAAKRLGASSAELIKYATSGDISGDRQMVVGYAGITVS